MKSNIKLNNIIFPIWLLWLFPSLLIIVLPANFIIDSLVLLIAIAIFKIENRNTIYKKSILKIWGFGFLSDIIGTIFMIIPLFIDGILDYNKGVGKWWYENITNAIAINPFENVFSFLWVLIALIIAGICIYIFNYKITFKKLDMPDKDKKKLALALAIFTAPYMFFLPTRWFY